jgi:hypothetical protein
MNRHQHSRCHYKRNSGSVPAGMNNLYTGEPAGRQAPGDSPTTSVAAAMVLGRTQPPEGSRSCDGTSQVIRPTYSCPCLTDIRHPVDVPKSLDKFGIFPYLTWNVSPVLQTLQNIGDKEMRKRLHNLHLFKKNKLKLFYYRPELKR